MGRRREAERRGRTSPVVASRTSVVSDVRARCSSCSLRVPPACAHDLGTPATCAARLMAAG